MHILVTGGAGYIGSHTAKVLANAGMTPVVFDDFSRGRREAVKWGPLVEGDLADRTAIERAFRDYPITAVIHAAGLISVGESMRDPGLYFRVNQINALQLLEAMHKADIRRIVFSSSAAIYGLPERLPITEEHPLRPVNPYGDSKLAVENALRWYGKSHGFAWAALRYFNAAGADPEGEAGEAHDPETHLIPLAIAAARGVIPHLDVYGADYATPDGTAIRDYIHVSDLGEAHLAALRHLQGGGENLAANLGTGRGHSVREVIERVERVSGRPVPVKTFPRRAGDPPALVADADKARKVLDWQPRLSSLESIVSTAWKWHNRKQP